MHKIADLIVMIQRCARIYYTMRSDLRTAVDHCSRHNHRSFANGNIRTDNCRRMYGCHIIQLISFRQSLPNLIISNRNQKPALGIVHAVADLANHLMSHDLCALQRCIIIQQFNVVFYSFPAAHLMQNINHYFRMPARAHKYHMFHYEFPRNSSIVTEVSLLIPSRFKTVRTVSRIIFTSVKNVT